jgi:two-component system sensor histidine kinase SenX3
MRAVPFGGGAILEVDDISEARRLDEVRRDFVANISHELKTPVGALALLAETLVGESDPTVANRLAQRIRDESQRLGQMVSDLLSLTRIESEAEPQREWVAVNEVLDEAVDRVRAAAEHKGVAIEVSDIVDAGVLGDRRQLVSAIFNLLDNAVTYSDTRSVVCAGARSANGEVEIWVTDEGIGISEAERERIFERFYRVDRSRHRATGGTGLGLAIVRHVAHNHGARVVVDSELGHGSRFAIVFPKASVGG